MKSSCFHSFRPVRFLCWTIFSLTIPSFAQSTGITNLYWAIPPGGVLTSTVPATVRYGVPFIEGALPFQSEGKSHLDTARVPVGGTATRIFLSGMTDTGKPHSWTVLGTYNKRYFIGDEMGEIRLEYMDGSVQTFPLVFGESLWWGNTSKAGIN